MGWLDNWAKRVKIPLDHNDIDAALSDFPHLIYISGSSGYNNKDITFVFDELLNDANRKKIAITKSDGVTECYVEIEKWDHANEKAWLWVKVPDVDPAVDTELYLYYDSTQLDNDTYVGDTNSLPTEAVWTNDYTAVWHKRDDPDASNIRDSTSGDNDGAKKGVGEPAITALGMIDGAQDYDGVDDYINVGTLGTFGSVNLGGETTYSWWMNISELVANKICGVVNPGANTAFVIEANTPVTDKIRIFIRDEDGKRLSADLTNVFDFTGTGLHHFIITADPSSDSVTMTIDAVPKAIVYTQQETATNFANIIDLYLGAWNLFGAPGGYIEAIIDDLRISTTKRLASWNKAEYETGRDHLNDFGEEEYEAFVSIDIIITSVEVETKISSDEVTIETTADEVILRLR